MNAQVTLHAAADLRLFAARALKGTRACCASAWRLYCLERNTDRWPDGQYHVLAYGYVPYRRREVAFTREELDSAGYAKLTEFLPPIDSKTGSILLILPEKYLRRAPREYRRALAAFVLALADMLEQRGRR